MFSTWIPTRDEASPLRDTNVSGITSPDGHVGSNSIGSLDSIGPVFTEQVTTTVSFFGITFLFVTLTLHNSLREDVLITKIKASTFSRLISIQLALWALTIVLSSLLGD